MVQRAQRASADVGSDSNNSYKSAIRRGQKRELSRLKPPSTDVEGGNKSESSHPVTDTSNQRESNNRQRPLIIGNYVANDFNVFQPKAAKEDVIGKAVCYQNK